MRPGDSRITCEWLQAGQPRPYADSIYEFVLTFEWIAYATLPREFCPAHWDEVIVKQYAKSYHGWSEEGQGDWASPRLKECVQIKPGVWRFKIVEPYTD